MDFIEAKLKTEQQQKSKSDEKEIREWQENGEEGVDLSGGRDDMILLRRSTKGLDANVYDNIKDNAGN